MPELPEVETVVRDLRPYLIGRTIIGATVHWKRTIATPGPHKFARQIRHHKIIAITRRGKYLIFHLTHSRSPSLRGKELGVRSTYLLVHLRMTGGFHLDPHDAPRNKHMHVCLQLDDGFELRFRDTRKFGRMWLVDDPVQVVGKLGPEPLEISAHEFHARIEQRRGNLKPLLLDQTFLAGIGNIYADESLWYARLHPLRQTETLTRAERGRLFRAIRQVLTRAIAVGGTSIDVMYKRINGKSGGFTNSLRAFDQEQRPCRRCGTPIQKTIVGQRGTHFCPTCQPRHRPRPAGEDT
jgi:formamidopyrimidine-DNA glycosylase